MQISAVLLVHICAGIIALPSGAAAFVVRKGSRLHRRFGDAFVLSMLGMAGSGAYLALMKSQSGNVFGGVFTFYLVATAWLTVKRREGEAGRCELGLLLLALAIGACGLIFGWEAAKSATGSKDGNPAAAYFAFGIVALLAASGDVRLLMRGGVSGAQRLVRHLWRMGIALFIAAGSFFLGTSSNPLQLRARLFTDAVRRTHLPEVPVLIVVILTLFWVCRVKFTKAYRKGSPEPLATPPRRESFSPPRFLAGGESAEGG